MYSVEHLKNYKVAELKELLKQKSFKTSGNKSELVLRLAEFYEQ